MKKRANSIKSTDGFSIGILDFVTERTKSVYLGSLSAALLPAVAISICTVYFLEKPVNPWQDSVPAFLDIITYPSSMLIGETCCQGTFRVLVSNKARLPINNVMMNASLIQYIPDPDYFFCHDLIAGSWREERLRSVCTPSIFSAESFTDVNGFADIENLSVVAGVPGMYVLQITAHESAVGRTTSGVQGTVYLDSVSQNFSIRVARNRGLAIVPAYPAPDTLEYGAPLSGVGPRCEPSIGAAPLCSLGARNDRRPPAATLVYSGNGTLSPGIRMSLFVVGHLEEVLLPDAQFPRTSSPHAAGSRLRMARLSDGAAAPPAAASLSRAVPSGGGRVEFPGLSVVGSTAPPLFLAFHACGAMALWNRHWLDADGRPQAQETVLLPPNGTRGERAGMGDYWMGASADGAFDDNGFAIGDQAYLTQVELADYLPATIAEGASFSVQLNAFAFRFPRATRRVLFVPGVVAFAEAVPVSGVRGAADQAAFWGRVKTLTGAVSRVSTGLSGPLFVSLAFSASGEPGDYRLRFYAEGVFHFEAEQTIRVTTRVNRVRLRLPYAVQMAYPGCGLQYYPLRDANGDGNPDRTAPSQALCVAAAVGRRVKGAALPYVEAHVCDSAAVQWSVPSTCRPAAGRRVSVRAIAPRRLPLAYRADGGRRWVGDVGNETDSEAILYSIAETDHLGRAEIDFVLVPQVFASGWLLEFSVGGRTADERIAVELDGEQTLRTAAEACGYTPAAQIRLLSGPAGTTEYPGRVWNITVFVVDMLGEPAADRAVCLRVFPLDWDDYFADQVRALADAAALAAERVAAPGTTLANMSRVPPVCFVTNSYGVGTLLYRHDGRDQRYHLGPFGWFLESAEFESGEIWDRDAGGAWVRLREYSAREAERRCYADFGIELVPVRTNAYYTFLHSQVTFGGPFRVLLTARYPNNEITQACARCPEEVIVTYPEKVSYYVDLQRRTVTAGESHYIYLRVYNGTQQSDDTIFPATLELRSYLILRPTALASRQCAGADPRNDSTLCYDFRDFELTQAVFTDSNGYAKFAFKAAGKYRGLYRVVFTVGPSSAVANFLAQTVEIEVVDLSSTDDCSSALRTVGSAPKAFQRCWVRMPDTSCSWEPLNLCLASSSNLMILSGELQNTKMCVPFGYKFITSYRLQLQGDNSLPLTGYNVIVQSPLTDTSLYIHSGYQPSSDENGSVSVSNLFLDYAEEGAHQLNFSIAELNTRSFPAKGVLSSPFIVTDVLAAEFVEPLPSVVGLRAMWETAPTVRVRIIRRCALSAATSVRDWIPPKLELLLILEPTNNISEFQEASEVTLISSDVSPKIDFYDGTAIGVFTNFSIYDGLQGRYALGVRVKGARSIIGQSSVFMLRTEAIELNVLDLPPRTVNSDTYLNLRVLATSELGHSLYNVPIMASLQLDSTNISNPQPSYMHLDGHLDYTTSTTYTNQSGIAIFKLRFTSYAINPFSYVIRFQSKGAYSVMTSSFEIHSPIKSIEILMGVAISPTYVSRWVWPLLPARTLNIGMQTFVQQVPVRQSPQAMSGSFVGEIGALSDPILRIKDHRNQAMEALAFNVTLLDYQMNVLDAITPSSRALTIARDEGFVQAGPSCVVNGTKYDCQGLYAFPILATSDAVRTGFYTFQFRSEGHMVIDRKELLFINIVLPDTLYKVGYMVGLATSILCSILIFQAARSDPFVLQRSNFQYRRIKWPRRLCFVVIIGILGACWFSADLFYSCSDQDKSPPITTQDSILSLDYISRYSIYSMFAAIFVCIVLSLDIGFYQQIGLKFTPEDKIREKGIKKLSRNESLEIIKRQFIGKPTRKIVIPVFFSKNSVIVRINKKVSELLKPFEQQIGELNALLQNWKEYVLKKGYTEWLKFKQRMPLFGSVHYSISDVFLGQRFIAVILVLILLVAGLHGVGLWLSTKMFSLFTSAYSYYMGVLSEQGSSSVDWMLAVAPDKKMIHLLQLMALFIARSIPSGGQPIFMEFLNNVSVSLVTAIIMTTVVIAIGMAASIYHARKDLCLLREGRARFDASKLKHIDACAYIGSQAGAVVIGWISLTTFVFSGLFFVTWNPFRDVFFGKGVMVLIIVSGLVYILSIVSARIAVRTSPGLYILFRARWALKELILCLFHLFLAPFETAFRLCIGGFRNLCTWFWFQSYVYENPYTGALGSMQYRASLYLLHQHNNPAVRSLVERLHLELRNKQVLRNMPTDNLEPAVIRQETEETRSLRVSRRTVSRILIMMMMRANHAREMEELRKQRLLMQDQQSE